MINIYILCTCIKHTLVFCNEIFCMYPLGFAYNCISQCLSMHSLHHRACLHAAWWYPSCLVPTVRCSWTFSTLEQVAFYFLELLMEFTLACSLKECAFLNLRLVQCNVCNVRTTEIYEQNQIVDQPCRILIQAEMQYIESIWKQCNCHTMRSLATTCSEEEIHVAVSL